MKEFDWSKLVVCTNKSDQCFLLTPLIENQKD